MKTKLFRLTFCFSLLLILLSCDKNIDHVTEALQKAEQCMEAHPDSALHILQQIPNPHELLGKKQADYGLLMTQAIDKNFMPVESDSLIQLAISYYENSNDVVAKGKAYFYYGRYLYDARKYEEALEEFLESKKVLKDSNQYKMLGLLAEYIGGINMQKGLYEEALQGHKESLEYYDLVKDTLSMTFALRNIGRIYMLKNEVDSVFYYYTTALKIASDKELRSEPSILHELGMISRMTGDYEKAESFMLASIGKINVMDVYTKYLSLGLLYFEVGKYDEAEKYLKKSLVSPRLENLSNAYNKLFEISLHKEEYKNIPIYIEKHDSIRSLLFDQVNQRNILELQKKYENEQLKNENLHIRNSRNTIFLLAVICMLVISIFAIYYYYHNYHNKRRIKDIEHTINQNKKEIEGYKSELAGYTKSKTGHQNEIGELTGKIALLTNQNQILAEQLVVSGHEKMLKEEFDSENISYITAFRMLTAMKAGTLNRKLSDQDIDLLAELFNFLFNGYIERLTSEFPDLTKYEILLCCLLKLRFTNQELCDALHTADNSIRRAKNRLKSSLNISTDEILDDFLLNY